ncbi:MAG: S-layer homology domain-containing protein [Candidatus Margulisbacteria bacterium]|nr:S-layer homology domain-containing protein [Candidatus Margulisiibacteriota bacterium]
MLGKHFFICMLFAAALSSASQSAMVQVFEPDTKTKTYNDILMLKGIGENLKAVAVNRNPIKVDPDGSFSCGLLLTPGKNFVEVRSWLNNGQSDYKYLKVLRLSYMPDVEKHWAVHEIVSLNTLNIIEAFPDGYFYPARSITRGELATWVIKGLRINAKPVKRDVFLDVPKEHWRAPYIKAAVEKGYMQAISKDLFGIDESVTRAEAARVFAKASTRAPKDVKTGFVDVPQNHPYYTAIIYAQKKGLIKGVSKNTPIFQPDRGLSRAEGATLISRLKSPAWLDTWLFDFNQGYKKQSFCKINTYPYIENTYADPGILHAGSSDTLTIRAHVGDREGLENILNVKVDLTPLGGPADAEMFDNGKSGDTKEKDGEYALQILVNPNIYGEKRLFIAVTDKVGWEGRSEAFVTVVE